MPLYAGSPISGPAALETPPPASPVLGPVWSEDVGSMVATWTDPTGVVWELSDTSDDRGYFTTQEIAGWGAMPYEIVTDPISRGGESVRFIREQPARVTWPLYIWGETHMQFVQRYQQLRRAIMMTVHRGLPGTLTVARPDGTARSISCFYEDGFGGEGGENWLFANPVLTLFCPDGAWRDVEQLVEQRTYGATASFYSPFLTISSSQVLGLTTVNNPGELTAWPDWTITGPCTGLTATNHTTGQTFSITYTLLAGEQITIVTGTNRPTVRGPAGQNLVSALNWPTAYLWGLVPDINNVEFAVAGSGAGSQIQLAFHPRYAGA